jgi:transcriptional regulator with XRE-family HTH domain
VQSAVGPGRALALRLRALREERWPDRDITQAQLAEALGDGRALSVPLISSWETAHNPKAPPLRRLEAYALFFATERSVEREPFHLVELADLTPGERAYRDELLAELTALREAVQVGGQPGGGTPSGIWRFPVGQDITIVCARLPDDMRARMPNPDPTDPDRVDLYDYADLDSLIELFGHIRSVNPNNQVHYRTSDALVPDDYTSHLVLLGGVDWNEATRDLFRRVKIPVTQVARANEEDIGGFKVDGVGELFEPTLLPGGSRPELLEDVALFLRGPSPYNQKRTLTICNGMFGRGTLGAVRALTDARFRDRNESYVAQRFAGQDTFSIITRVPIANGRVLTPDWTKPDTRRHEWP